MVITLDPNASPAVVTLANVLFQAIPAPYISTTGQPWPYEPDSTDFSRQGLPTLTVSSAGAVALSFSGRGSPVLSGMLDSTELQEQIVTAPNYFIDANSGTLSGTTVRFDSPAVTKVKGGVMAVIGNISGTQSTQDLVTITLYRDYGTAGQIQLGAPGAISPGGIAGYNWWGRAASIDRLPDAAAHTYTIIAMSQAGSVLNVGPGGTSFAIWELGPPG